MFDEVELLSDLSTLEKENLSMFCQEKHLNKGEILFKEEEDASAMYLLKEGNIEISTNLNGKVIILGDVHAEEIIGEMALFGETEKRMATATALTECNLIVILSFSIKELTKKHPNLMNKIKSIINLRNLNNDKIKKKYSLI